MTALDNQQELYDLFYKLGRIAPDVAVETDRFAYERARQNGVLLEEKRFPAINMVNGDSIEFTYKLGGYQVVHTYSSTCAESIVGVKIYVDRVEVIRGPLKTWASNKPTSTPASPAEPSRPSFKRSLSSLTQWWSRLRVGTMTGRTG